MSEFSIIDQILEGRPARPDLLRVGPGDDAAVLAVPAPVVTIDLMVEDVHFRRGWLEPEEIGARAVSGAVSDLAAMGARPVAVLLSLAGTPADAADGILTRIGQGARVRSEALGATLAGGDVTRSPRGLVVDVVALGSGRRRITRAGARPGDELWVTGTLGAPAAAVAAWDEGLEPAEGLRHRFADPSPRIEEMIFLSRRIHAGMDISDGLLADAGHLARSSGVGVVIHAERVPIHPEVGRILPHARGRELALTGGDEYELLVAAPPGLESRAQEFESRFGLRLTRVGEVTEGEGVSCLDDRGRALPVAVAGFDHFGASDA